jgi:hypothetical protein
VHKYLIERFGNQYRDYMQRVDAFSQSRQPQLDNDAKGPGRNAASIAATP